MPAPQSGALRELGALIEAATADGRAGALGDELDEQFEDLEEALDDGERKEARAALRELTKVLREAAREGQVDAGFAAEAGTLIERVADEHGLRD